MKSEECDECALIHLESTIFMGGVQNFESVRYFRVLVPCDRLGSTSIIMMYFYDDFNVRS